MYTQNNSWDLCKGLYVFQCGDCDFMLILLKIEKYYNPFLKSLQPSYKKYTNPPKKNWLVYNYTLKTIKQNLEFEGPASMYKV